MLRKTFQKVQKAFVHFSLVCLKGYRLVISPWLGPRCRFYPSCSIYAEAAIKEFGLLKGLGLIIKRLLKCHPFHPGGVDPLPKKLR